MVQLNLSEVTNNINNILPASLEKIYHSTQLKLRRNTTLTNTPRKRNLSKIKNNLMIFLNVSKKVLKNLISKRKELIKKENKQDSTSSVKSKKLSKRKKTICSKRRDKNLSMLLLNTSKSMMKKRKEKKKNSSLLLSQLFYQSRCLTQAVNQ